MITNLTVHELSEKLVSKELTATQVTQAFLDQIKATNDNGAFISVDVEGALEQAKKVDEKREKGEILSPLAGIPIGIKDNIHIKDQLSTCGSKMLATFRSPFDATVVQRMKDQDMVLIGKTNMDEFAIGTTGESSFFGPSKNPWNTQHVAGGSSSGSATAVAEGAVPIALGTDTGGSIRVPCAFCGIVGLKPTYGTLSRYGAVAMASSLDQIGPMARSVKDIALLFDAIKGYDPKDAVSTQEELTPSVETIDQNIKGIKIGLPKEYFNHQLKPEIREAVEQVIETYKELGAEMVEVSLPSADQVLNCYYIISSAELSSNLARYDGVRFGYRTEEYDDWEELFIRSRSEGFSASVQKRILAGTYFLSAEQYESYYQRAKQWQKKISDEVTAVLDRCDVLLTPTTNFTAPQLGAKNGVEALGLDFATVTASVTGIPAISMPCGLSSQGLPLGVQLLGAKYGEDVLLRTAYQYEKAVGGFPVAPAYRGDK